MKEKLHQYHTVNQLMIAKVNEVFKAKEMEGLGHSYKTAWATYRSTDGFVVTIATCIDTDENGRPCLDWDLDIMGKTVLYQYRMTSDLNMSIASSVDDIIYAVEHMNSKHAWSKFKEVRY